MTKVSQSAKHPDWPLIISHLPREVDSRDGMGTCVTAELYRYMVTKVLPVEMRSDWIAALRPDEPITEAKLSLLTDKMLGLLDDLIIEQTENAGWRMFTSELVLARLWAWELQPGGIELYARIGKALTKFGRVMQRQTLPPIDGELRQAKQQTVEELRTLLKRLHTHFAKQRTSISSAEIVRQFCTLAEAGDFPNLRANLDSWLCFMSTRGKKGLIATRTSPGSLFDAWISWSMEYEQETLRQKIASQKTASL